MKQYEAYTIEKGLVESDSYSDFGALFWHREDGPAFISYYDNGNICREEYRINNKIHRVDGPAVIKYTNTGTIEYESYWLYDVFYNKYDYHKELLKLKVQLL